MNGEPPPFDTNKYMIKTSTFMPLIITVIGLIIGSGVLLRGINRNIIKSNWSERRCDPEIMFTGFLYAPDDSESAMKFAADNFNFCMDSMFDKIMQQFTGVFMKIFGAQVSAADAVGKSQGSIQMMIGNVFRTFADNMDPFYKSYRAVTGQIARVGAAINRSFQRIHTIILASVYSGISMMYGLLNTFDAIIKVVMIIIIILMAISIILFLFFFPAIPIIVAVITALVAAGFGAALGGAASVFCFGGATAVRLQDGTAKRIKDLQLGDILWGGGVIEGLYQFSGYNANMYTLDGVEVTADHLVWNGEWIDVAAHPAAHQIVSDHRYVYCPVVSNRCIPVIGLQGIIWFRDWEELCSDDVEGYTMYHAICARMLGSKEKYVDMPHCISPNLFVLEMDHGVVPVNYIHIGDSIYDSYNMKYTLVTGIYRTTIQHDGDKKWISGSCWYANGKWVHPRGRLGAIEIAGTGTGTVEGIHLITESGIFTIYENERVHSTKGIAIRDAIEIGDNIRYTYDYVLTRLDPPPEI
jgi:hypothetical protein